MYVQFLNPRVYFRQALHLTCLCVSIYFFFFGSSSILLCYSFYFNVQHRHHLNMIDEPRSKLQSSAFKSYGDISSWERVFACLCRRWVHLRKKKWMGSFKYHYGKHSFQNRTVIDVLVYWSGKLWYKVKNICLFSLFFLFLSYILHILPIIFHSILCKPH